jgi:hypothetical protein
MIDPNTPLHPGKRPEGVSMLMLLPALLGIGLLVAVGGLALQMSRDGSAAGDRVAMRFQTTCAAEVGPVLMKRAHDIGLGDPTLSVEADAIVLTAALPGLGDDRVAVPALLTRPGTLLISAKDGPVLTEVDLADASFDLDEGGTPITRLKLLPQGRLRIEAIMQADPGGALSIVVDGEALADRPNSIDLEDGQLRLPSGVGDNRLRARLAADRAISLSSGPLPCPTSLADLTAADG